jgi:iron(III) transport system ATP-binding protein
LGTLTLADGMPTGSVDVLVRPEQVRLDAAAALRVRVLNVTFYGHDASIQLDLGAGDLPTLSARVHGHDAPQPGEETGLLVDGPVIAWPRKIVPGSPPD